MVWETDNGEVWGITRTPADPGIAERLDDPTPQPAPTEASAPDIGVADGGAFTVVWHEDVVGGETRVLARSWRGGAWQPTETVVSGSAVDNDLDLAVAPDGSTAVVWEEQGAGDRWGIRGRLRDRHGAWEAAQAVEGTPGYEAQHPQVAAYDDGSFVADWGLWSGIDSGYTQAAILDRTPPRISLTPPARGTEGVPIAFSPDVTDRWSALESVVWRVSGQVPNTPFDVEDGFSWTPTAPGNYVVYIVARDTAGNQVTHDFSVDVDPAPVVTDPEPDPTPDLAPPPDPRPDPKPDPAPDAKPDRQPATDPRTCETPFVELVGIEARGTRKAPRVRLTAVTGPSLVGRIVSIRRDGKKVGRARVGRDRTVVATVAAPRAAKARAKARYRVTVGTSRSRALKATRMARVTSTKRMSTGRLRVAGRVDGVRRTTAMTVTGRTVCGAAASVTTRVRTDARGRFRTTLSPAGSTGAITVYRIAPSGARTVTLPIVLVTR
ncbi:MAG: hypothetical protein AB7G37_11290 [Solirubrobacteraceae bacterium]